jgi:hydrogenase maturation protease
VAQADASPRIVGVGQRYAGDDGVGRAVVEELHASGIPAKAVDDGAGLLNILMGEHRSVVVIDAVVGGGNPGAVHVLRREAFDAAFRPVSSHGVGVLEAIDLATRFHPALDVTVVGISIEPPTSIGEGLSAEVAASVTEAARRVRSLLPFQPSATALHSSISGDESRGS